METFKEPFPLPFIQGDYQEGGSIPKTVDELEIIKLSIDIREKPDCYNKIKDPKIISKWKEEISKQSIKQWEAKLDYALDELQFYSSLRDSSTGIEVAAVENTWQSDRLIEEPLKQQLINYVSQLENVPEKFKDWHPGSNGQVLDLVHPSLYCFVNGRTKVLKQPSQFNNDSQENNFLLHFASDEHFLPQEQVSELAFSHRKSFPDYSRSSKFQWLPSEFKIGEDGKVQIKSYINNLHPENHSDLYRCIEKIFERFIPLFNKVLTDLRNPLPNRVSIPIRGWYDQDEISNSESEEEDAQPRRIPLPLDIPKFSPPSPQKVTVNLNGRTLQVIVKLANIHLTPEKPQYLGGVWHVEGMANESIVASGIHYYSSENVTESRLLFRQAIQEPDYEQNDNYGVEKIYGLRDEEPLNQDVGSIITKQDRCIAFPNTLQHRVAPFKLEDSTRVGHRKILVFFLIDPTVKILSTAQVPPQQKSWFLKEIEKDPGIVPEEIVEKIVNMLDWPMTLEEAKTHRDELMKERKFFIKNNNEELFERAFSLCEH